MSTRSSTPAGKPLPADGPHRRFDGFRLARERGVIEGSVDAASLERVAERLMQDAAPLAWRIEGTTDSFGRPAIEVALDGEVELECQRCLQAQRWPVQSRTLLVLARDEADLAQLDADSDDEVVLASVPLEPATLVEDELVLALPYAPRHPDGECAPPQENE